MVTKKFDIDEKLVQKLAQLLTDNNLNEIEFESGDQRIRINKAGSGLGHVINAPSSVPINSSVVNTPISSTLDVSQDAVTSPMVGTIYLAAEPGAKPFISVGNTVSKGQTLLIIEAMKVMNPIQSPKNGVIKTILVSDGQPVEYGEPLVIIQ
ncbi:MAG: acetyl-CoA carboxylase biotin carboxyl carrier protein [Alphaproteobacteria bacterium]|nr:acetyl-CoA carboxylase biotin carboxyl carrier protein [Alphaproteobacteria bacterium]